MLGLGFNGSIYVQIRVLFMCCMCEVEDEVLWLVIRHRVRFRLQVKCTVKRCVRLGFS